MQNQLTLSTLQATTTEDPPKFVPRSSPATANDVTTKKVSTEKSSSKPSKSVSAKFISFFPFKKAPPPPKDRKIVFSRLGRLGSVPFVEPEHFGRTIPFGLEKDVSSSPSISGETQNPEEKVSLTETKCEVKTEPETEDESDDERKDKSKNKKKVKKYKKERKRSSKRSSSSSESETETDSDESSSDESEKKKRKKRKSKQKTAQKKKAKKNKKRKVSESSDEESDSDSDGKRKKKGKKKKSLNKIKVKKESSSDDDKCKKRQKKKKKKIKRETDSTEDSDDEELKKSNKTKGGKSSEKPLNKKVKFDKFWTSSSDQSSGDENKKEKNNSSSKKPGKRSTKNKAVSSLETKQKEEKNVNKCVPPIKNIKFAATEFYQLGAIGKKGVSPIVTTERIARSLMRPNKPIPEPKKVEPNSQLEGGVQESTLPIKHLPQGFVQACAMQRPIFKVPAKISFLKPVSRSRIAASVAPVKPEAASLPANPASNQLVKSHIGPNVVASRSIISPKYAKEISVQTESVEAEKPKFNSPVVSPPNVRSSLDNESTCVDLESDFEFNETHLQPEVVQIQTPSVQNCQAIVVKNEEPSSTSHLNIRSNENFPG